MQEFFCFLILKDLEKFSQFKVGLINEISTNKL